jgi:8-oxo-dGTP pyrophosphatase MutT (NUDIX family)
VRILHHSSVLTLEAGPVTDRNGDTHEFLRLRMPDWVAVAAVDHAGDWLLVEQHRFGTSGASLEVVGGVVDPGESPGDAARRELLEETGHAADTWVSLGAVRPNPTLQDNTCSLFLALGSRPVALTRPDPTEALALRRVGRIELGRLLGSGAIDAALSVLALERALHRAQAPG